ncbi:hypothetical protein [Algihabitans sp.]|uniref:hypothetical protein n=1 Tax=Algihabitans sp. TaxID=2821514 RepID=UPI003BA8CF63
MTLCPPTAPLDAAAASQQEIWSYAPEGRTRKDCPLKVTSGKPLDAVACDTGRQCDNIIMAAVLE